MTTRMINTGKKSQKDNSIFNAKAFKSQGRQEIISNVNK